MADDLSAQLSRTNEQLRKLREELAADYAPRDEQARRRRSAIALVLVAMAGSLLVNNGAITRCFIGGPPTGIERSLCGLAFPGYEQMRRTSDQRLAQFLGVLEAIPENTARSEANTKRIAELEWQVKELERRRR